ncbi:cell wall-binding repeat-containing protein [Kineococcus sp. SYSU DK006]|uniref:cell wall-binding repeat-containing protein n=1 Tax=Kineococcus sp. SYSU DK006 TaxID=3383127 RepID=UPI003D7EC90D
MTAATSRLRRRGIGAGVAALVGLTGLGFAAVPAQAAPTFDITRPANTADRFETAASIALATAPNGAANVIVANGDNAVDALAAASLAGTTIPILYVQSSGVPAATANALRTLNPTTTWIVGGTTAVPTALEASLPGTKQRIQGADRYATAANIAQRVYDNATTKPTAAFVARGDDFADALAIAPYAAKAGVPVLLTETGTLNPAVSAFLSRTGIKNVTVLGGTSAVSTNVETALTTGGATVTRIQGDTRQQTAVNVANTPAFGFSRTGVTLVNGFRPVDALPASVWSAQKNFPIISTDGTQLGAAATGYLDANKATLVTGFAAGGATAIPETVVTAAETAGGASASNQGFAVAGGGTAVASVSGVTDATSTRGALTYTVTGLPANSTVAINLFPATGTGAPTVGANGSVTFTAPQSGGSAVAGQAQGARTGSATTAFITSVNGVPVSGTTTAAINSVNTGANGTLTFVVNSYGPDSVVPVVFANSASGNNALDVSAAGVPSEAFGVGPAATWTAPAAGAGTYGDATNPLVVASVNKTASTFSAARAASTGVTAIAPATFTYDSNDTFFVGASQVTQAVFAAALSRNDTVYATIATDPSLPSTFNLVDAAPTAPGSQAVVAGTPANTARNVTFADVAADSYNVYRATVPSGGSAPTPNATNYTRVGTVTDTNSTATPAYTYSDTGLTAGTTYAYFVTSVQDGDESAFPVVGSVVTSTTAAAAADTTAPTLTDVRLTTSAGLSGTLDTGDVITLAFSEPVAAPASGTPAILRVRDADGSIGNINVYGTGANATAAQAGAAQTINGASVPANQIVVVTLTGAIVTSAAGTNPDVQIPATITDQSGFADAATNALNVGGSADVVIDVES